MSLKDLEFRAKSGEAGGRFLHLTWRGTTASSLSFRVAYKVSKRLYAAGTIISNGSLRYELDADEESITEALETYVEFLLLVTQVAPNIPNYRGGGVSRSPER